MASTPVFSGARAIFKINQNEIGYASGVNGSESIDYEPVEVLDLLQVKEFVPVAYRATLAAQIFRIIGNSLKKQSIFPRNNMDTILTSGDLTCSVQDRMTGETMANFLNCKAQEHSFDITARGIVSENVNFVTIKMMDESDAPVNG
jgi:hypothetical protein